MNLQTTQSVFLIGLVSYLAIRGFYQRQPKNRNTSSSNRSTPLDKSLVLLVVLGQVVIPLCYILTPWLNGTSYASVPGALNFGTTIGVLGIWMFWRSHADLGSNWSVTLEVQHDHQLIERGVYRALRHPMYGAFFILAVAQALLLPNVVAGASAFLAVTILCMVRTPREEAMLCEEFGPAYRQYMQTTGGVLPKLFTRPRR